MIAVFLADGFEEIEALATVDILRRVPLEVRTVGVGTLTPCGSHGLRVQADMSENDFRPADMSALVLPGGMPGTVHLEESPVVRRAITDAVERQLPIGAICAAPSILGHMGILRDKQAVCYPGFEPELTGAHICNASVVTDGQITTAKGAGVAVDFALRLVKVLTDEQTAADIRSAIQCP